MDRINWWRAVECGEVFPERGFAKIRHNMDWVKAVPFRFGFDKLNSKFSGQLSCYLIQRQGSFKNGCPRKRTAGEEDRPSDQESQFPYLCE